MGALLAGPGGAQERARPDPPDVDCAACIVVDATGEVLFHRRPDAALPNASTTKIFTALVVVNAADLGDHVTVSGRAAATPGGGVSLAPGDRFTVEQLLHILLMESANDAAVALAEHVSGTEASFVAEMNRTVRALGARPAAFRNAHGLDASGHAASPRALAVAAAALLRQPVLRRIVGTRTARVRAVDLENSNPLLDRYRGATGVKTGMTAAAGNVLVASAERGGTDLVAVSMRSRDPAADARAMLDYGFALSRRTPIVVRNRAIGAVMAAGGGAVAVVAGRGVRSASGDASVVRLALDPGAGAPVAAGDRIGSVEVLSADRRIGIAPALAGTSLARPGTPAGGRLVATLLRSASLLLGRA